VKQPIIVAPSGSPPARCGFGSATVVFLRLSDEVMKKFAPPRVIVASWRAWKG